MKDINSRKLQSALRKAGYEKIRTNGGSHAIYSNGTQSVSVPLVNGNFKVITKIVQKCGLKEYI